MNQGQSNSISVAGIAGAFVALIVGSFKLAGITIPPEMSDAALTLATAALAYYIHRDMASKAKSLTVANPVTLSATVTPSATQKV